MMKILKNKEEVERRTIIVPVNSGKLPPIWLERCVICMYTYDSPLFDVQENFVGASSLIGIHFVKGESERDMP